MTPLSSILDFHGRQLHTLQEHTQFHIFKIMESAIPITGRCWLFGVWRYLMGGGGDIWHLSQSSSRPSIYFCSIVKSRPNQPVLSNKGKVSCSRKQQGPLVGLEPTTSTLRVRRATLFSDSTKISSISAVLC